LANIGFVNSNIASAEEVSDAISKQDTELTNALTELDKVSHLGSYKSWITKNSDLFKRIKENNPIAYKNFQEQFSKIKRTLEAKGVIKNGRATS
jgi:histidyl-tRNA synthetase